LNAVAGIFISYRRDDNRHAAGRLYDSLQQQFPRDQIFFDVDKIELGSSFVEVIQERVAASDVLLVVIGLSWISSRDGDGRRRLDDPEDLVRVEIETGLRKNIRVIPVLIDGATMPRMAELPEGLKQLHSRQAITLHHSSFQRDAEHLNAALSKIVLSEKAASTTGSNAYNGVPIDDWKAELVGRRWNFFSIRMCRLNECHQVECRLTWRMVDYVEVDGARVFGWTVTGWQAADFKLGSYAVRFRLKFRSTSFYRLKQIELWADDRRILFCE
jgi:TIR domain